MFLEITLTPYFIWTYKNIKVKKYPLLNFGNYGQWSIIAIDPDYRERIVEIEEKAIELAAMCVGLKTKEEEEFGGVRERDQMVFSNGRISL